ncbi:MAG: transposase [Syntrophobacteraceae bacterium]|jgi:hypothetical protein
MWTRRTSLSVKFAANQVRLLIVCLACNILHIIRDAAFRGKKLRPSVDWIIRRFVNIGVRVVYHAGKWCIHIASAFPLARNYRVPAA